MSTWLNHNRPVTPEGMTLRNERSTVYMEFNMATQIDTLSTYEAIAAAGIEDKGARAISKAIADSTTANRADLATKSDISELKELIASTQNRTLIWMFGMLLAFAMAILTVIKLI